MSAGLKASLSDGTVAGALQALTANGPIAEQNLDIISLDAVRANLGDRWMSKREQVWHQVEKFLRHKFGPDDLILRLDDVSVLILQPGRSRLAAKTRCVRTAHDMFRFFLGEKTPTSIMVKTVEAVVGDEVVCAPLSQALVDAALLGHDAAAWAPTQACTVPLLTPMGRELSIDLSLAPVLALQGGSRTVGYAARTTLADVEGRAITREDRAQLQSSDLAGVDLKVLATALERRSTAPHPASTLIIPVSYATLAHSSTRYQLLQAVHHLSPEARRSFIWEIVDFETGVPAGRVAELTAIARPHCRGVICRMELSVASAEKLKAAGAGLSVQPQSPADLSEYALLRQEATLAAVLRNISAVMYRKVPPELLPVAAFIGITHCTVAEEPPA